MLPSHGVQVVLAGRRRSTSSRAYRAGWPRMTARDRRKHAGRVRSVGIVSDGCLASLYHHSLAVLAPSRYEGFGLVPLEALEAGAWVVASRIPAHTEVLAESADYFSPGSAREAIDGLLRAIGASPEARLARQRKGRSRAAAFSVSAGADAFEASLRRAGIEMTCWP
jgi:glycosyltransferase involved in cell wall biosynthesis